MYRNPPIACSFLPAVLVCFWLASCSSDNPQPLTAEDFYSRHVPSSPLSPLGQPGIIPLPDTHVAEAPRTVTPEPSVSELNSPSHVPPPRLPANLQGLSPQTPTTLPTDQYMTLGAVVAVVNGTPIFANKVLAKDVDVLRSYARQMNEQDFEVAARAQVYRTLEELKDDELEIAAAERSLDPKDIQMARALTRLWTQNQIDEAGGSEQVARLRALESGESFDDQEQDQYRHYLTALYFFRKINPEVDFTEEDEKRYYRAHIDEFTTPRQATIILIEADPQKVDGNEAQARSRLEKLRNRAMVGEDFARFGRAENDLPGAEGPEGNGGQMTIKPNSFILTNVEAAVWKTPAGQISDVIEDQGAYYLFKVLTKETGGTKPFSDQSVQEAITRHLTDVQRAERRNAEIRKLELEQITPWTNIQPVMDMVMQNYPAWSKSKP